MLQRNPDCRAGVKSDAAVWGGGHGGTRTHIPPITNRALFRFSGPFQFSYVAKLSNLKASAQTAPGPFVCTVERAPFRRKPQARICRIRPQRSAQSYLIALRNPSTAAISTYAGLPGEHGFIVARAYSVGSAVEKAYRRQRALEKRRKLMEAWARHCDRPASDDVIPLRKGSARTDVQPAG
jgi:hypothetical protein